jgi:hypothetical protein
MEEFLANPAVQAAAAPFAVALVISAALFRTRMLGLAVVAAFVTAIALTIGFSFESLTAVRKLIVVGISTGLVAAFIELRGTPASVGLRTALSLAAAVAALWVVWRVLHQMDVAKIALYGAAVALFSAALVDSSLRAAVDVIGGAIASLVLGLAAGALGILGASVLLGQIGIATAAGAGAVLLVQALALRRSPSGWTVALPGAVITASLPWYCVLPTLAIPWAARVLAPGRHGVWVTAGAGGLAAIVPAAVAIGLAWFVGGGPG